MGRRNKKKHSKKPKNTPKKESKIETKKKELKSVEKIKPDEELNTEDILIPSNEMDHEWKLRSPIQSESEDEKCNSSENETSLVNCVIFYMILWAFGFLISRLWTLDKHKEFITCFLNKFNISKLNSNNDLKDIEIWNFNMIHLIIIGSTSALILTFTGSAIFLIKFWGIHINPLQRVGSRLFDTFRKSQNSFLTTFVGLAMITLFASRMSQKQESLIQILRIFKLSFYVIFLKCVGIVWGYWNEGKRIDWVLDIFVVTLLFQIFCLSQGESINLLMIV